MGIKLIIGSHAKYHQVHETKQNYLACLVGTLKEEKTLLFNISYGGIALTRRKKEWALVVSVVIILCDNEHDQKKKYKSEKYVL